MVLSHVAYYDASGTQDDKNRVLAFVGTMATEDREDGYLESPSSDPGGVSGEVIARVHQDSEVAAVVAAKTQRWGLQLRVLGRLREASQSILSLIRAERAR